MKIDYQCTILAVGAFAIGTDSFIIAGLLPNLATAYNVSVPIVGQLVTAYALSYALFSPVLATLTCHLRKINVLIVGLAIFAAANLALALCTNFAAALLLRGIAGLGAGLFTPTATAVAAAIVGPEQRNRAIATVMIGLSVATAIGSPLGVLLAAVIGWRAIFCFVAALAVCVALLITRLFPTIEPSPALSLRQRLQPLANRRIALILFSTFLVLTGLYTTYTYASIVFAEATGHRASNLALLLSIWGVAATLGSLVGRFADRFGNRTIVNVVLGVLILDFCLIDTVGSTLYGAAIGVALWGICGWAFVIPQQHRLISAAPQIAPVLVALHLTAVYAGTTLSGIVGAIALRVISPINITLVSAAFVFCGLGVSEALIAIEKRRIPVGKRPVLFQSR